MENLYLGVPNTGVRFSYSFFVLHLHRLEGLGTCEIENGSGLIKNLLGRGRELSGVAAARPGTRASRVVPAH